MAMRGRRLPLGTAALGLVLALATVGVVFGLWSKVLTVEGEVHTGTVHASWDVAICSEFHPWPLSFGSVNGEFEGKDVGSTSVFPDPSDNNLLHLVIENGYPSYSVDCEVEYKNDGTIPFIIRGFGIEATSPNLTNCSLTGDQNKTLACDQLTVILIDGIGSQIHPGESVASSVRVHVEQAADQDTLYSFAIKFCVAQWNESATFDECVAAAP